MVPPVVLDVNRRMLIMDNEPIISIFPHEEMVQCQRFRV